MSMTIDKEWFCTMVQLYQNDLYRLAYHILNNKEDAEDALQETLYRAYSNLENIRHPKYFKTWITRILLNTSFEIQKKRKPYLDIEDYAETLGDTEKDSITALMMEKTISELDEKYQKVILLYYYEDFNIKEISKILDISILNVKQRLSRSRKMLKEILTAHEKGV